MAKKIELKKEALVLKENKVEGFLERIIAPFETLVKVDVPRKYIGRRVYVIIIKD